MGNTLSVKKGDIHRNDQLRSKLRKIYGVDDSFLKELREIYEYSNLLEYENLIDNFYQEKFPPNSQIGNSCGYDSKPDTNILKKETESSSNFQNSQLKLLNPPSHDPSN